MVIIADGKATVTDNKGDATKLGIRDVFGSVFQSGEIRKATKVEALSDSVVFLLSIDDFYSIMANHHELTQQFVKNVSKRIAKTIK